MWKLWCFCFFWFLLFVGVFLRKHDKNKGFSQFGALLFFDVWVQKVGSISGPGWVNKWATFGLMVFEAHVAHFLTQEFCFHNVFWSPVFFSEISFSLQKEDDFKANWKQDRNMWPTYWPNKGSNVATYWPYYLYIYICLWVSLWSTFFQFAGQSPVHIFFSKIGAASSITISSPCSRYKPMKNNSGAGQSVVHPLVSLWSTFLTTYPSKMWTIDWPGGGPETDLQFYQTRPPKRMIFSNTKHYKKRGFGTPTEGWSQK